MLAKVAAAHLLALLLAAQQTGFDGRVQATPPPPVAVGADGELSVTILDTPAEVSLVSVRLSSEGVVLPDNRLGFRDVVDPKASQLRIRARFIAPARPGVYAVDGLVEYVTCDDERCRTRRGRVGWDVRVVEADRDESWSGPDAPSAARDRPRRGEGGEG